MLQDVRKEFKKETSISNEFNCMSREKVAANRYKVAVRNFSMSFRTGEVFGLLGPNGAGKVEILTNFNNYL